MLERLLERNFLGNLLNIVLEKAAKEGNFQNVFLNEMLKYIDSENDPNILYPPYKNTHKKILVNAYSNIKEESRLQLYVVDYDSEQSEDEMLTITMSEINSIAEKAKRFYTNAKLLFNNIDPSQESHSLARTIIENDINNIDIIVVTNRFYRSNKMVKLNIPGINEVHVHVWDVERAYQLYSADNGDQLTFIDFKSQFDETFEMMYVPDNKAKNFECYIGFIPAELLAKIYNFWGPKLVERNVRSFLQARAQTNRGIRDTLKNPEERKMFVAYNNGISSVARSGDIEKSAEGINLYTIKGLDGWQIVNGGQTTASIHRAYLEGIDLSDVYIQTKLTILKVSSKNEDERIKLEDNMVAKISEFANTQNKINKSDLLANTRFMSEIEMFSRSTWIPVHDGRKAGEKWYFERTRGQYMVDVNRFKKDKGSNNFKKQNPSDKVLSKVDLAKYFMSWEGFPHISSKGGEAAFKEFMEHNSLYWKTEKNEDGRKSLSLDDYKKLIARVIINMRVHEIVSEQKLKGYRANVVYYSVAILKEIYGDQISLIKVWENQKLSDVWNPIIATIANVTLNYLRDSAGERNVTQWAKQEACWDEFKKEHKSTLQYLR
ncbi:AIPR family protein [Bacillus sp. Bwzl_19]